VGKFHLMKQLAIRLGWQTTPAKSLVMPTRFLVSQYRVGKLTYAGSRGQMKLAHPTKKLLISHEVQQVESHRFAPLAHLWERGWGRGCAKKNLAFSTVFPLPNPLPQVGEGIAELRG